MPNYISILESTIASSHFELQPFISAKGTLGFKIVDESSSNNINLQPYEQIRFMVSPHDTHLDDGQTILLGTELTPSHTDGKYFSVYSNLDTVEKTVNPEILIGDQYAWENTAFDLYYLQARVDTVRGDITTYYNEFTRGIYTYPHVLEQSEVSMRIDVNNLLSEPTMSLTIKSVALKNEDSTDYAASEGPYRVKVRLSDDVVPRGWDNPVYYVTGSTTSETGVTLVLPYFDERYDRLIPAQYIIYFSNYWVGDSIPNQVGFGGYDVTKFEYPIEINNNVINNGFKEFDKENLNITEAQLEKVNEILIPADKIERRRLVIGIEDISLIDNTYYKTGEYVSQYYPLDFNIYTFSISSIEDIPKYPNLDSYEMVKYYVEFNNQDWIRISPTNRTDERENNILVPKLIIFDKSPDVVQQGYENIKFMNSDISINILRVKIVIDMSKITDQKFTPPIIRDYKCQIFDRNQLTSII